MDQEALRKLVSTSSSIAKPSASSNSSFGKAHRRNPTASSSSTTKPIDLKPHKLKSKSEEDGYVDRAAARRSGTLAAEFEDVEALHQDFEARIAAAETEEEKQKLRDQISSVGGDAKYSVLVKGLDWGLLAQNKAKLEREGGGTGGTGEGEGEGDLEPAYQEAKIEKGEGGGKRSREDIVEAVKRRREGKTSSASGTGGEGSGSGFRPIGFKPIGATAEKGQEEDAEYKWVNGKRMRKKKKPTSTTEGKLRSETTENGPTKASSDVKAAQAPAKASGRIEEGQGPTSAAASVVPVSRAEVKQPSPSREVVSPPIQPPRPTSSSSSTAVKGEVKQLSTDPPQVGDNSEDEDIFADVGGWDGILDTKDEAEAQGSDEEEGLFPSPPPFAAASTSTVPELLGFTAATPAEREDETSMVPQREASPPSKVAAVDGAGLASPQPDANVVPSEPNPPEMMDSVVADSEPTPIALQQPEQPSQTAAEEEVSKAKQKKSKWDDLDDEKDRKKKKKRSKHH